MAINAQQRALLDTISWAEGTWDSKANRPRYDITFGYQSADPSKPHPGRVVRSGRYASDATGAYQFLSTTWKGANGGANVAMTPDNQDRAALQLVRGRGVDPTKPLDAAALDKLAPEWASLPTMKGGSYYGQPSKSRQAVLDFYNQRLGAAPNPGNAVTATASAPGGGTLPAAGGADVNAALLQAIQAASGGGSSSADLVPLISGLSGESAFIGAASAQQKRLDGMIDDLGRSLAPREATAERRFAYSPFFSQALNLLG